MFYPFVLTRNCYLLSFRCEKKDNKETHEPQVAKSGSTEHAFIFTRIK